MIKLAKSGLVTENEYLDVRLWYYLNRPRHWTLIESGVCGTILLYALIVDFMGDMDGTARAFLSNRYRRIDNAEILEIVLPELMNIPDAKYESCQITDSRMYIKVVNPRLQAEVSPGDIVQAGVIISNSEVGQGSVSIQPLVYRLVCSNGMVINDAHTRK